MSPVNNLIVYKKVSFVSKYCYYRKLVVSLFEKLATDLPAGRQVCGPFSIETEILLESS